MEPKGDTGTMPKKFNGPSTWDTIVEFIKRRGPQKAATIAYHLAGEGLQSKTVGYGRLQRGLIDHIRLTLKHAVSKGVIKFDALTKDYTI